MKTFEFDISLEGLKNKEYPKMLQGGTKSYTSQNGCVTENNDIIIPEIFEENVAYNTLDFSYMHIPIFLGHTSDYMGIFTDFEFTPLTEIIGGDFSIYYRLPSTSIEDYYFESSGNTFTGYTLDYLNEVKSYDQTNPYVVNVNYSLLTGSFTGVIELTDEYVKYVINGETDQTNTYIENTGLILTTYFNETIIYYDSLLKTNSEMNKTIFEIVQNGWNETNSELYQPVKEEIYFGQVLREEEDYDVFIERDGLSVKEAHLRLAEVSTLNDLELYNRKYYNL